MNALALMYVGFGGAVGAMARYAAGIMIARIAPAGFPYATFIVNVSGSLLLGVWIAIMATLMPGKAKDLHLLIAIGFLGGFTTFSTFSLDAFLLMERGLHMQAFFYVFGSVMLSVIGLVSGMLLVKLAAG